MTCCAGRGSRVSRFAHGGRTAPARRPHGGWSDYHGMRFIVTIQERRGSVAQWG